MDWLAADATRIKAWVYGNRQSQDEKRYDDGTYALLVSTTQSGGFRKTSESNISGLHGQMEQILSAQATLGIALDTRHEKFSDTGVVRDVAMTTGGGGGGGGKGGGGSVAVITAYGLRNIMLDASADIDSVATEYSLKTGSAGGIVAGAG